MIRPTSPRQQWPHPTHWPLLFLGGLARALLQPGCLKIKLLIFVIQEWSSASTFSITGPHNWNPEGKGNLCLGFHFFSRGLLGIFTHQLSQHYSNPPRTCAKTTSYPFYNYTFKFQLVFSCLPRTSIEFDSHIHPWELALTYAETIRYPLHAGNHFTWWICISEHLQTPDLMENPKREWRILHEDPNSGLGKGLRSCISNKIPNDTMASLLRKTTQGEGTIREQVWHLCKDYKQRGLNQLSEKNSPNLRKNQAQSLWRKCLESKWWWWGEAE